LRIGNLLHDRENRLCKVEEIKEEQFYALAIKGGMTGLPNSAIPLTEQWLIDLGLKRMPESEYTLDSYDLAGFKLWMNKGKFLFNDKINIDYVHQLQNLYFALTGEELTIKN